MNNLTLQQKIVYPILGAFALIIAAGCWYFVSAQIDETEFWYREELRSLTEASGFMPHSSAAELAQLKHLQFHMIHSSENTGIDNRSEIEKKAAAAFKRNPKIKLYIEEISVKDEAFLAVFKSNSLKPECTACHAKFDVHPAASGQEENLTVLFGFSGSLEEIRSDENKLKLFAALTALAAIAVLGWAFHRTMKVILIDPIRELKMQTEIVAGCDLRKVSTPALERKLTSADEMGYVTRAFVTMIQMLRANIRNMYEASNEVADASAQITSSIEEIAAGAQEQANHATEVSNSIEEMTRSVMLNSKSADEAVRTAEKARLTAERGGKIVSATAEGMKKIAKATSRSSEIAKALEKSSKKIGEIVKLINDIADQTSLLALNAATEAARAGEQGKGFSIVADEVRKLSERTMKATKEIETMIKNIQQETGRAVISMDEGTLEVKEGMKLADQAGQSLSEIVDISQKVTEKISQIAASSEQQSTTSEQITQNVEVIHSVTKQMADNTKEVASASESLKLLTGQLKEAVNQFRLDKEM
ncbi:MAG: methyl-accepting chemotaxis protein [Bacteroidetes bacterium]|nr:methyl-accepting chemotaxis protein [Bacteroidota bacterium]